MRCATACTARTSSTAASRTCCCSRSSPMPASARWCWGTRMTTETTAPVHGFDTQGATYCPFMPVFGPPKLSFVRGKGTELWDSDGNRYLDFLSGIAVVSLGHANPVVAEAIAHQASTLLHVSNFFTNPVATDAAFKLVDLLGAATGAQGQVFFTNSGAEA